jgi:hypothetical protein
VEAQVVSEWAQDHRWLVVTVLALLAPLTLAVAMLVSIGMIGYMTLGTVLGWFE